MSGAYLSRLDVLSSKNRLMVITLLVMLAFNVYNWNALHTAQTSSRVALIPIAGGTGMWVGNGKASDEYLRAMGRYVTGQLGNYQAGTYRKQLQELLLLFPSDTVGQAQTEFYKLADEVDRYPSISSVVQWLGDTPMKLVNDWMQIHVNKIRLVNGQVTETSSAYYCIEYRIADTQFQIIKIDELSGSGDDLCLNKYIDNASPTAGGSSTPEADPAKATQNPTASEPPSSQEQHP